jgi:multicomponent Na+:H+ antiporter subunit E
MAYYLLLALPLALGWMIVTDQFNPGGLLVGYSLGLLAVLLIRPPAERLNARTLPGQMFALIIYIVTLFRDIFLSSIFVARIALAPRLRLRPGLIRVPTGDLRKREISAALSAHNITITPGELVVDFEENDAMLVHTLDRPLSEKNADANQARRMALINRILEGESR